MVIQRNWKHSNENAINGSDDSNGSSHTNVSTATSGSSSKNQTKYVTTPEMAENVLAKMKHRFGSCAAVGQKSSSEAVMRSFELLRINIQSAFDNEIDKVVKKFTEMYFKPALKNIKHNLSEVTVSDDVLQKMSCALLENSKSQYNSRLRCLKTESCTQTNAGVKRATPPNDLTAPLAKKPSVPATLQSNTPQRRHIFWNTANISTETRFILDVQANLAFGFSSDGKERLASKHPELIRYLPDAQDRDWLVEEKIIPAQNRNSRFLFLIYDEVVKLAHSETYSQRENLNLSVLQDFKIPNVIIEKMQHFFVDLNIKSRGLITNSYSAGLAGSSSSHLRNALLQRPLQTVTPASASPSNSVSTSTDSSVSTTVKEPPAKQKSLLSSSHATLSALLSSSNRGPPPDGNLHFQTAPAMD